jgi:hypothetical protein
MYSKKQVESLYFKTIYAPKLLFNQTLIIITQKKMVYFTFMIPIKIRL